MQDAQVIKSLLICSHLHSLTTAMVEVMTTAVMEEVMRAMEEEEAATVVAMGVVTEIAVMVQVRYNFVHSLVKVQILHVFREKRKISF